MQVTSHKNAAKQDILFLHFSYYLSHFIANFYEKTQLASIKTRENNTFLAGHLAKRTRKSVPG